MRGTRKHTDESWLAEPDMLSLRGPKVNAVQKCPTDDKNLKIAKFSIRNFGLVVCGGHYSPEASNIPCLEEFSYILNVKHHPVMMIMDFFFLYLTLPHKL